MREFQGLSPQTEEDPVRRVKWQRLDWFLRDLSQGMGRIQNGLKPDGSGQPLVQPIDDIYLVLTGRPGNQVAHGGTRSGGKLTLSSTSHPTKGLVYLGETEQSAWDETNSRLGISTTAATAKVHIKVGAVSNTNVLLGGGSGPPGSDWANIGGAATYWQALSDVDPSDTTYARWTASVGQNNTLTQNFANVATNPGGTTGYSVTIRARANTSASDSRMILQFKAGAQIFKTVTLAGPNHLVGNGAFDQRLTGSFTDYPFTLSSADVSVLNTFFTSQPFTVNIAFSGLAAGSGTFDFNTITLTLPPVGGVIGDTLQKWENPTTSNTLAYANDGAGITTLAMAGTPKFRITNGLEIATGSPASGMVAIATDTDGTVAWASASSLATKIQHRWVANGYYRSDTNVDGAWIASAAATLSRVTLYRRQGGSAGSLAVDLMKNGTSVLSSKPTIAFNAGASATANGTIQTTTIAAGDVFYPNATADSGHPQDWTLEIEVY